MKYLLLLSVFLFGTYSCEKYEDCTIPIVGVYEAYIVGESGSFDMVISIDNGDNIKINHQFDLIM